MQVVDTKKSEYGPQRKRTPSGRLLHCCCICGRLDVWSPTWVSYCSIREIDEGRPFPKFCSDECRRKGGIAACDVTDEMKRKAKDAEWREPRVAYREANDREKYRAAVEKQKTDAHLDSVMP